MAPAVGVETYTSDVPGGLLEVPQQRYQGVGAGMLSTYCMSGRHLQMKVVHLRDPQVARTMLFCPQKLLSLD